MNTRAQRHLCLNPAQKAAHQKQPKNGSILERPLPAKPPEMAWRDYVILLLHIGSELEHCLMVQYLYAAYSLNDEDGTPEQRAKVRGWRDLILTVAREEMGHLLTVQNVLCVLGGPVSMDREDVGWDRAFMPFPFRLEPLSLESLRWYVYAEKPHNFTREQAEQAGQWAVDFLERQEPEIARLVNNDVAEGRSHTVGELYDRIIEIIENPRLIPDSDFRPDTFSLQASWDDWGRGYRPPPAPPGESTTPKPTPAEPKTSVIIVPVGTRTETLAALREIGGQGEAFHLRSDEESEASHFERFVKLLTEFESARNGSSVRRVPRNPTTVDAADAADGATFIEAATSRLWANLCNVRYRMLLTYLTHTFRLARTVDPHEPNTRGAVMHRIFGEMYNLKAISSLLVKMPLRDKPIPSDPENLDRAGPPFQMPYSLTLPLDEVDCWRLHHDILHNAETLTRELMMPEHVAKSPPEAVRYLQTLRALDRQTGEWLDQVLKGLHMYKRHHHR